jgi:uncharacterized surface protein with fasciclin (FAS1) repeats
VVQEFNKEFSMKNNVRGLIALCLVFGLSGCANNNSAAPAAALETAGDGEPLSDSRLDTDIVDTAVGAGSFQTLAAALGAANLVDTLKGEGPFTVFAPTDAAFAKLPSGTVEALLNDIPALTNILVYHVAAGEIGPSELLGAGSAETLQGKEVAVREMDGAIYVNGSKVEATLRVKNGIIYVIDSVLLP